MSESRPPMRVLVVDDDRLSLRLLEAFLTRDGHWVTAARDGRTAVELFLRQRPDLVLMDVAMPRMSGIEAAEEIRRESGDTWVPLIFLSASSDRRSIVAAFAAGGAAYINKPFDPIVLRATIAAFERIAQLQRSLNTRNAELEVHRDTLERERELALHITTRLLDAGAIHDPEVWQRVWPAKTFSGDVTIVQPAPGGARHVLVADSCGKGLAAALCAYPIVELFRDMTRLGYSIGNIAARINERLIRHLPPGRFVAASLMSHSPWSGEVRVWSGGTPPPVFLSDDGSLVHRWRAAHPPLGILSQSAFDEAVEVYRPDRAGTLLAWTDGLSERFAGEVPGDDAPVIELLREEIRCGRSDKLAQRLAAALESTDGIDRDDVALVSVRIADRRTETWEVGPGVTDPHSDAGQWHLALRLGAAELRRIDPLPMALTWLEQLGLPRETRSTVFLVLSEMLTNAIDHGLLGLDSALKDEPDGFSRYLELRRERLEALEVGIVSLELGAKGDVLSVRISDSGAGFDVTPWLTPETAAETRRRGRGIALTRGLSSSMAYGPAGNTVELEISLRASRDLPACPRHAYCPLEREDCWSCPEPADAFCAARATLRAESHHEEEGRHDR